MLVNNTVNNTVNNIVDNTFDMTYIKQKASIYDYLREEIIPDIKDQKSINDVVKTYEYQRFTNDNLIYYTKTVGNISLEIEMPIVTDNDLLSVNFKELDVSTSQYASIY